jgi:hypothetical protein
MTMLEHINGPEDLKQLSQDQLGMLASEIREFLVEVGDDNERPPRPQPRRRRADDRAAPGLRLAEGTSWSSIPVTSRTCTSC